MEAWRILPKFAKGVQEKFEDDFSADGLRILIILWCIGVIILALNVKSKWFLAAILVYEVLP